MEFGTKRVEYHDCRASEEGKCDMLSVRRHCVGDGSHRDHLHLVLYFIVFFSAVCWNA